MSWWLESHGLSSLGPLGLKGREWGGLMEETVETLMGSVLGGPLVGEGNESLTGGRDLIGEVMIGSDGDGVGVLREGIVEI